MKRKVFQWAEGLALLMLVMSIGAPAQNPKQLKLSGIISDYTLASGGGPWDIRGEWSLTVRGNSGEASFSAAFAMVHSDLGVTLNNGDLNDPTARNAHTHHITMREGTVTPLSNGFRVTGPVTVTANGKYPPPFGPSTTLQIDVTGGNSVPLSNIKMTFVGDAATHFGSQAVNGVVVNK